MARPKHLDTSGLKPWKPGQSGNPNGRPKKNPVTEALKVFLDQPVPVKYIRQMKRKGLTLEPNATWRDVIGYAQLIEASKGNTKAFIAIADRIEGKPKQKIEIDGQPSGIDITVKHIKPDGQRGQD